MTDIRTDLIQQGREAAPFGLGGNGAVEDFWALLKPRVMSLVIFTALVGIVVAPGGIHPWLGMIALLCIAVGAGASGALNMWFDADIDAIMKRTASRPVPAGRVLPGEALTFGMWLATASVLMLGVTVNWVAAGLLAFTIFFYAVIYTMWLKRSTPQNIVIGGAAGAFPPMVGWTAVTGSIDLASLSLFAIIFMWTPPHFWALALFRSNDYERAGVPMMPNVAGHDETRRLILYYALAMIPVTLSPLLFGFAGWLYGIAGFALSVTFAWYAWRVYAQREGEAADRAAKKLFGYSIIFLFAVFATLLVEHAIAAAPAILARW
ncbi:MAG: protoheme IX farnesyltransferase [Rhizobiales bacterium]|nr:protoheme IX farnesyltransferase [Hyphomicrobiales bacterium]